MLTFEEAIEAWLATLRDANLSVYSVKQYRSHLGAVLRATCGQWPTHEDILRWRRSQHAFDPTTQCHRIGTVRKFFGWCAEEQIGPQGNNPAAKLKLPPRPRKPPPLPTEADIDWLLRGKWKMPYRWGESWLAGRDRLIVLTIYATGIRNGELCRLDVKDLDFERKTLWVRQGKGGKPRAVAMPEDGEWLRAVRQWIRGKGPDEPVFESRKRGRRLHQNGVGGVFQKLSQLRGKRITAHMLRHAYATDWVRGGQDVAKLAHALGHASISTTQMYLHLTVEDQREGAAIIAERMRRARL